MAVAPLAPPPPKAPPAVDDDVMIVDDDEEDLAPHIAAQATRPVAPHQEEGAAKRPKLSTSASAGHITGTHMAHVPAVGTGLTGGPGSTTLPRLKTHSGSGRALGGAVPLPPPRMDLVKPADDTDDFV
jgi:hypothetical protein